MSIPNEIRKKIVLRAPRARVWAAISDASQFGAWFGAEFPEPFAAGKHLSGKIRPTQVDPEVAKLQEPHAGKPIDITIERIEPLKSLSFRWHPYAVEPNVDYSKEPTTLITFELVEVPEGTELTITETGFGKVPLARRAEAFKSNEGGWEHQLKLVQKYVDGREA